MINSFYSWLTSHVSESGDADYVFNNMSTTILQGAAVSSTGNPAIEAAGANVLRRASTLQHLKNFGGILTYMTSKWALACLVLVRFLDLPTVALQSPINTWTVLGMICYILL